MPKVSVIVPIYGVEKYIERCARSLFEQSLDDVEYIFVNDCTKDNSMIILQQVILEYPKRKSQVKIICHDNNKGLPTARQTGVLVATGEYIAHCDSDDWVNPDMYRAMYEKAKENNYDVVVCDYTKTDDIKFYQNQIGCHDEDIEQFCRNCFKNIDSWAVWNKLCKRSLFYGIMFPVDAMGEDMVITIQLLLKSRSFAYVSVPFYNYYINPNSITKQTKTIEKCLENYNQLKRNTDIIVDVIMQNTYYPQIMSDINCLKYNVMVMLLPVVGSKKYYDIWKSTYKNFTKDFLLDRNVPVAYKVKYLLTLFHLYPQSKNRLL